MKAGYAKRKKVKRARSRKARREDAGDDQEAAAAELTGMGGRAVREDDSDESGDEAMATDDLERVDVTSRVPTTPNDESPPSTSREQPPVTGRAKHKLGVRMSRAIRSKMRELRSQSRTTSKGLGSKARKRALKERMKGLLIEQAAVKAGVGGGVERRRELPKPTLSRGVDPQALESAIHRGVTEAYMSDMRI